jgi:uncharacterized protein YkwD
MILVDMLIIAVLALYGWFGYRRGFIAGFGDLMTFAIGLAIAFVVYKPLGGLIVGAVHIPRGLADLAGFFIVWTALEFGLSFAWKRGQKYLPEDLSKHQVNRAVGVLPSLVKGMILVVMVLLIVAVAPIPTAAKQPFTESTLGKMFLGVGTTFQQQFNNVFGQALRDTLAFKTIKTGSDESSELGFTEANPKPCPTDERRMLEMVNQERRKVGLAPLKNDEPLKQVGRAHSADMLKRGYFSHNTPEGVDPFERMEQAGIVYETAGENLAYAPTVEIAMTGLMNSPGHKANILKPEYRLLGVGCMDAGVRGKMFSQEFGG